MKISLSKEEVFLLVKRSFPLEIVPFGYDVTEVEEEGPSYDRQVIITLSKVGINSV